MAGERGFWIFLVLDECSQCTLRQGWSSTLGSTLRLPALTELTRGKAAWRSHTLRPLLPGSKLAIVVRAQCRIPDGDVWEQLRGQVIKLA